MVLKQRGAGRSDPDGVVVKDVTNPEVPAHLVGLVLESVAGEDVSKCSYDTVMQKVKAAGRPLKMTFSGGKPTVASPVAQPAAPKPAAQPTAPKPATGSADSGGGVSMFGGGADSSGGGSMFGGGGSMFGAAASADSGSGGGGLFGAADSSSGVGLFGGAAPAASADSGGGLFGGAAPAASADSSGGLFGGTVWLRRPDNNFYLEPAGRAYLTEATCIDWRLELRKVSIYGSIWG